MATIEASENPQVVPARSGRSLASQRARLNSGWAWMALACALIAPAGYFRDLNARRIGAEKSAFEPCPFNLEEMPSQIGEWTSRPGQDQKLDAKTIQITGSMAHILRTYVDSQTGVQFSVLLLYGPAEPVVPHTPEICYPSSGYGLEGSIGQAGVPCGDKVARFRTATYSRPGTMLNDRARVYYSFRMDGEWAPDITSGKKFYRNNPGIFKVQVHRPMRPEERTVRNEPMERFLGLFLREIEARIEKPAGAKAPGSLSRDGRDQGRPITLGLLGNPGSPACPSARDETAMETRRRDDGDLT